MTVIEGISRHARRTEEIAKRVTRRVTGQSLRKSKIDYRDVCQDTLTALLEREMSGTLRIDPDKSIDGLIYTIAYRIALRYARRRTKIQVNTFEDAPDPGIETTEPKRLRLPPPFKTELDRLRAWADGFVNMKLPFEWLDSQECSILQTYLRSNCKTQHIVYSHYIDERTGKEIGRHLGMTEDAVHQNLSRFYSACREEHDCSDS